MNNRPTASLLLLLLATSGTAAALPAEPASDDTPDLEVSAAGLQKHRKPQRPPIRLGTSGGNANDFVTDPEIPCRSGTLGALVQGAGGVQYILSSNRHLAMENDGRKGDPVTQPGLVDTRGGQCNAANPGGHVVADLAKYKRLKFGGTKKNKVDAALAEAREGMVDPAGRVLGIGTPGSHVIDPVVGQRVRKSGRGTGVRKGTVIAVNVVGDVADYRKGATRFVRQFVVETDSNKPILGRGDSGSVFFETRPTCPGWVGLAVAFSIPDRRLALVSPMSTVLKQLKRRQPKGPFEPVGCGGGAATAEARPSSRMRQAVHDAERIQLQVQRHVLRLTGVVGMGIGAAAHDPDEVVFKILVEEDSEAVRATVPERLGKVRCEILEVGGFHAM